MDENDTFRHLKRTPAGEFMEEVSKLNLYSVSAYAKEFVLLNKLAKIHNWTFEESVMLVMKSEQSSTIDRLDASIKLVESILKE